MTEEIVHILHFNDTYTLSKTPRFLNSLLSKKKASTITLFSGDIFFPSFMSFEEHGSQMVNFLEEVKVDFGILGNHDFEMGEERCIDLLKTTKTNWIMTNLMKLDKSRLADSFEYKIIYKNNFKIGILGFVDISWIETSIFNKNDLLYKNFIFSAKKYVRILKNLDCDIIIALTHMMNKSDELLMDKVDGIDLILGGHEHCYFIKRDKKCVVVKSGSDFESYNEITIYKSKDKFKEQTIKTNSKLICNDNYYFLREKRTSKEFDNFFFSSKKQEKNSPKKKEILKKTRKEKNRIKNKKRKEIQKKSLKDYYINIKIKKHLITSKTPYNKKYKKTVDDAVNKVKSKHLKAMAYFKTEYNLKANIIRSEECNIGNLISDFIKIEYESDIALVTGGHIRSEKIFKRNSKLHSFELINMVPYTNGYEVVRINGKRLKKMLEESYRYLPNCAGCFMHVSGIRIVLDVSKKVGQRIERIFYKDKIVGEKDIFSCVILKFVFKGKDGFTKFSKKSILPPKAENFNSLYILRDFFELASIEKYRKEFLLFKKFGFCIKKFDYPVHDYLNHNYLDVNLVDCLGDLVFKCLTRKCIKRLKKYCLVKDIFEVKDGFLWAFGDMIEKRLDIKS